MYYWLPIKSLLYIQSSIPYYEEFCEKHGEKTLRPSIIIKCLKSRKRNKNNSPYSLKVPSALPKEFVDTQLYVPMSLRENVRITIHMNTLYPLRSSRIEYFDLK